MPTEKKWVVDEKGYHVVSVHTPAQSSSSSGDDDTGSSEQTQDDTKEVRLIKGTWLPGDDGFAFNKKCKAQVELEYLKETSRRKLQIQTFVEFEGEDEDLKQTVDAFANDQGIAEAEVTLFYGEKYYEALEENPGATCNYKFIATHPKGTGELVSELLEMPQKNKLLGGICIYLCNEGFEKIENQQVTIKANGEEIFNDTLSDGMLEISDIPAADISLECEIKGNKTDRALTWIAGEPPYPSQLIIVPSAEPESGE